MKDIQKRNVARAANKANNYIVIECVNVKGHTLSKKVNVANKRIIRHLGQQEFVITPVEDGNNIIGYAVEDIKSIADAVGDLKQASVNRNGGKVIRRKAPSFKKEIYNTNMLPDGMYVCGSCKILVAPGHRCSQANRGR